MTAVHNLQNIYHSETPFDMTTPVENLHTYGDGMEKTQLLPNFDAVIQFFLPKSTVYSVVAEI